MTEFEGRPVACAPGYFITHDGRVISHVRRLPREIRARLDDDGYPFVELVVNGRKKTLRIHRLVARAFLPARPSPAHEIRHLDGTRTNCREDNLAWGSRSENGIDRVRHGNAFGNKLKLTIADVLEIRRRASAGEAYVSIADHFPVGAWQVSAIARGLQWAHVGEEALSSSR